MKRSLCQKIVIAGTVATFLAGCGSSLVEYDLRDLKYPVVMNANPFVEGGGSFNLIDKGNYTGQTKHMVVSSGQNQTQTTVINNTQIEAVKCLGGEKDRAITEVVLELDDRNGLIGMSQSISGQGRVVEIKHNE